MKRLIAIILILVLIVPATAIGEEKDPIIGPWYIMFEYKDSPYEDEMLAGKNYMIYILIFEESGTISGMSGESMKGIGFYGSGSTVGTWLKAGDTYAATITGIGTSNPTIENDRLLIRMTENVHYVMRRMEIGDWNKDMVFKY